MKKLFAILLVLFLFLWYRQQVFEQRLDDLRLYWKLYTNSTTEVLKTHMEAMNTLSDAVVTVAADYKKIREKIDARILLEETERINRNRSAMSGVRQVS